MSVINMLTMHILQGQFLCFSLAIQQLLKCTLGQFTYPISSYMTFTSATEGQPISKIVPWVIYDQKMFHVLSHHKEGNVKEALWQTQLQGSWTESTPIHNRVVLFHGWAKYLVVYIALSCIINVAIAIRTYNVYKRQPNT